MSTTTPAPAVPTAATAALTGRILVADSFEASGLEALEAMGCRVHVRPDLGPETLGAALLECRSQVLIVRSTKVPTAVIEQSGPLSLIIRAGAGYDNIDVETASRRGIYVANCPGKNALAVAELAWGLILACDRRIPDQLTDLRNGRWAKGEYARHARGMHGRTLGVIGLGTIGEAVADRARAFGMEVIAWSRSLTPERAEALDLIHAAAPIDVARAADVVSISVASNAETRHLVDEAFIAAMKDGAILVNTSRGAVVDEAALAAAVRKRGIRAGLDVWENQPGPSDTAFSNAIVHEAGVVGTHHCGASTDQSQQAIAAETVRIVREYLEHGEVPNCINRRRPPRHPGLLTVRHYNRPGVLAHVFEQLSRGGLNIEEMENVIYEGAMAACARIRLDRVPSPEQIAEIVQNEHVLSADLSASDD